MSTVDVIVAYAPKMDGNYNYQGKCQSRPLHQRGRLRKERGSKSYSSSSEDFHSDDNLRPYEEVKLAHHDKKLAGLGLTSNEHAVSPLEQADDCRRLNNIRPNFHHYRYVSGSDGDNETDNPASSPLKNRNCHGSHSSVSSDEDDSEHLRHNNVSRLSLSESDQENTSFPCIHQSGTLPLPPPMLPPPPPPIEDIPRQRTFGPSIKGNYSDVDNIQRHCCDIDHGSHQGHYSDAENLARLHNHYSEGESDFEPHYLVQTSSGNVFIPPDMQPRFPRTVPRAGTLPNARPCDMPSPQHICMQGLDTLPPQFLNGDAQGNNIDRLAFTYPHQYGGTPTIPMAAYPVSMTAEPGYYSKFSSASHRMKKHIERRCSWRCTALILLILCVAMLACVAYFAAMVVFEEKEKVATEPKIYDTNTINPQDRAFNKSRKHGKLYKTPWQSHSSSNHFPGGGASLRPTEMTPAIYQIGEFKRELIPPKSFWQAQFKQENPSFVRFNFTIPRDAVIGIYGRRTVAPTVVQYDFFEVIDGRTLQPRYRRSTSLQSMVDKDTALVQFLKAGTWYLAIYNDEDESQNIALRTNTFSTMGTSCPGDCYGHGDCHEGQCRCFPGYTSWDCAQNTCPILCNANGIYMRGACKCFTGWKGRECETREMECEVPTCNGNGRCEGGQCICYPGFQGPDCGMMDCRDPNCSGAGVCYLGHCVCFRGYKGLDCSIPDKLNVTRVCAKNCSSHGHYDVEAGKCICERFFTGYNCETEICRLECFRGHCENQKCMCDEGWAGALCDQLQCDRRCGGERGICNNGSCECRKGWNGNHCSLDGCPNSCSNNGNCQHFSVGWKCNCGEGWKGPACDVAMETTCNDNTDNDVDELTDCEDPDCCMSVSCKDSMHCKTVPNPEDILLRKQAPSTTASFFEKIRFLIEDNSVQIGTSKTAFNESQVSVIRGQVRATDGTPLIGVRVHVVGQPLYGYTLTREQGLFDILVNGGGSVTLEFTRQPLHSQQISVLVPWNQIIAANTVVMVTRAELQHITDPTMCGVKHEYQWLSPVVLSTWQHTQLGACPEKSTVIPESQVLQESITIPGTNVHLVYHSSETPGYMSLILIQMTPKTIPSTLALVHLRVSVEGVLTEKIFEADPWLKYTFAWDRMNAYRQKVYGIVTARVDVGYQYQGCDHIFWEARSTTMSGFDLTSSEIGAWNLDIHHTYNFQEGILHKGDGTNIYMKEKPKKLINILGNGHRRKQDCDGCNGRAIENRLLAPVALACGRDGSLYVWDYNFIRKLSPNRQEIASILEIQSELTAHKPYMTVSPVDGRLYISDYMSHRVIRVKTMGPVRDLENNYEIIAGNGEQCIPGETDYCGDEGRAQDARLAYPKGIAISKDGIIYIADNLNIRMITTDSIIHTLIGSQGQLRSWIPMSCEDSLPADAVRLQWPTVLAIDPLDDTLNILDKNIVLKLTNDHKLLTIAGRPINCPEKGTNFLPIGILADDEQASSIADHIKLANPGSIAFGPNGDLYIVESDTHNINRVRVVTTDGRIHHVAGTKSKCDCEKVHCKCYDPKQTLAAQALFKELTSITVTPDGIVHIADSGNLRVFSVVPELPQPDWSGQYVVVSPETQEVYIFNHYGQHRHTVNIMTDQFMYNFTYHVNSFYGKLTKVQDAAGNHINIMRDDYSRAQYIISPDNSRSQLVIDNLERLHKFLAPDNTSTSFTYMPSTGLLRSKYLSDGKTYTYDYDDVGRLRRVSQPTGEITHLKTDVNTTGSIVHITAGSGDMVAMATYGSVQSVMHGMAKTQVTYLPDGAVVVVFPSNLTIAMETGGHPILENQYRMHFKRKVIAPNTHVHRLEWRFYLRRKGRTKQNKIIDKLGRRMRVGPHFSRHANTHDSHEEGYKEKALLVNGENLLTLEYDRDTHTETIMDKDLREIITIVYDRTGLPTHFLPAMGHQSLNISYNQYGAITRWDYGDMHEYREYSENGLLKIKMSANNAQYRYQYRYGNMPTDILQPSGLQYYLEYDKQGNLNMIRTPGLGKHYFYRLISIGIQRYLYQVPQLTLPYIEDYDGSGKLLNIIYPSERKRVVFHYSQHSKLEKVLFDQTEVQFEYNQRILELSTSTLLNSDFSCVHSYTYMSSMVGEFNVEFPHDYKLLGAKFKFDYDDNFQISRVRTVFSNNITLSHNKSHDDNSAKLKNLKTLQFQWPLPDHEKIFDDHVIILRDYDKYGRIQSVQYQFQDMIRFKMHVSYDSMNRVSEWSRQIGQGRSLVTSHTFDINGNLIDVHLQNRLVWKFGYDNNANINIITNGQTTKKLEFDVGSRIKTFDNIDYKFDNDGFMVRRGSEQLKYNSFGQLTSIFRSRIFKFLYSYDPLGRLVVQQDMFDNIIQYFYGDILNKGLITHTYNHSSGEITQYFYYIDGRLIAMERANNLYYIITDPMASPLIIFDKQGYVVKNLKYTPLGQVENDSNTNFEFIFGFQGGLYNPTTHLVHFQKRVYDTLIGHWVSPDYRSVLRNLEHIIDDPAMINIYQYRHLIGPHSGQDKLPIMDVSDWLTEMGFDIRGLAPYVSYNGEIKPTSRSSVHELVPSSSAFECTFQRDMYNLLAISTVPQSKISPLQTSPIVKPAPLQPLPGNGIMLSIVDGKCLVTYIENTPEWARTLITVLLNGSLAIDVRFTIHGKVEYYFIKTEAAQAKTDLKILGIHDDHRLYENGMNVTIYRHRDAYTASLTETSVRLHGQRSVINIRYGTSFDRERKRILNHAKKRAEKHAWQREKWFIENTLKLSKYRWLPQEIEDIRTAGYADGYDVEYIRSPDEYPELADDCNNVRFVKIAR